MLEAAAESTSAYANTPQAFLFFSTFFSFFCIISNSHSLNKNKQQQKKKTAHHSIVLHKPVWHIQTPRWSNHHTVRLGQSQGFMSTPGTRVRSLDCERWMCPSSLSVCFVSVTDRQIYEPSRRQRSAQGGVIRWSEELLLVNWQSDENVSNLPKYCQKYRNTIPWPTFPTLKPQVF